MKKTLIVVLIIVAMVFTLVACGGDSSSTQSGDSSTAGSESNEPETTPTDTPVKLTVAHGNAAESMAGGLYQTFADDSAKNSGNSLELQLYPAGSLVTSDQLFDSISSGRVDMGDFVVSYYAPYMEDLNVLAIPGIYKGGTEQVPKIIDALKEPIDQYLQQNGIKLVCVFGSMTESWFVGSKVIKDPKTEFKGLSVRTSGSIGGQAVTKWGGAPASIPIGDLPTALERKTVDIAMTAPTMIGGMQLYASAPHITKTFMEDALSGICINLDKWNSLSENQQKALTEAGKALEAYSLEQADQMKIDLTKTMEDDGVEVYEQTDEDYDFYHSIAMEMVASDYAKPNATVQSFIDAIKSLEQ